MSMRAFEAGILAELRQVQGDRKILQRDILAWQMGAQIKRESDDEIHVYLPRNDVHVCYRKAPKGAK